MIKNLFTYTCIIFLLFSFENCNSQAINYNLKKEEWVKNNFSTWPQILLTNMYQFEGRRSGRGGSAFLIEYGNDTFACTAKHLLGDAMSIEPEVPLDSVNTLLIKWKLFARKNVLSNDTIIIKSLVKQEKTDKEDILLFDIEPLKTNIMPLKLYLLDVQVFTDFLI